MDEDDKDTLFWSIVSGLLGALGYMTGLAVKKAEKQENRAIDDAVTRFNNKGEDPDE